MQIRFISTLTPEDEERLAPTVLKAVTALLDTFSLAYTIRLETTSEKVFQHSHPAVRATRKSADPTPAFIDGLPSV